MSYERDMSDERDRYAELVTHRKDTEADIEPSNSMQFQEFLRKSLMVASTQEKEAQQRVMVASTQEKEAQQRVKRAQKEYLIAQSDRCAIEAAAEAFKRASEPGLPDNDGSGGP